MIVSLLALAAAALVLIAVWCVWGRHRLATAGSWFELHLGEHVERVEALWFLSPHGRRAIGAPARRTPGLSIPDLEHRRATARFFLALIERSRTTPGEGVYRWLGEQAAQHGTGASVRPDGYARYLLPDGEITFYLEIDRTTETPLV